MTEIQLPELLRTLIDDAKTALLITSNPDYPDARWMTPVVLDSNPLRVYSVTGRDFIKTAQIYDNEKTTWMFQSRLLDKIIKIKGKTKILNDEDLLQKALSGLAERLDIFWKINKDETKLVLLETVIEKADVFFPLKAEHHAFAFKEGSFGKN